MKTKLAALWGLLLLNLISFSQTRTLVNQEWKAATGHPVISFDFMETVRDGAGNAILIGNTYVLGHQEDVLIAKYSSSGALQWAGGIQQRNRRPRFWHGGLH